MDSKKQVENCDRLLIQTPENVGILINRSAALIDMGLEEEALADLKKVSIHSK